MGRAQNKQFLNAVLDASHINGTTEEEEALDEEEVKKLAIKQEESRKRFDNVLAQPSSHWRSQADVSSLQDALVIVLDHIRGEGTDAHRMAPSTNPAAANGNTTTTTTTNNNNNNHTDNNVSNENTTSNSNPTLNGNHNSDDENHNHEDMAVDEFTDASDGPTTSNRQKNRTSSSPPQKQHHSNNNNSISPHSSISNISSTLPAASTFPSRAKYIPLRLTFDERKLLRLVEAALNVSEYTDAVDVLSTRSRKNQRIHTQIRDLCSILTGLAVANDYTQGQKLVADRDFQANEQFFKRAFEIARRHKVANPEKSRDTYGKLIHMLQDSAQEDIKLMLEFSCVKPMLTVHSFLEERNGLNLLNDYPLIETATKEIIPDGKTRRAIQNEIQLKERAVKTLAKRYRSSNLLSEEDIKQCLYSISDNNSYLRNARDPCDIMIKYLHYYFKVDSPPDKASSLSIAEGIGGARLTHDHARQFKYVYQSLALWREVCHEMYKLWYLSEKDLLNPRNPYILKNTGQGLNRVQASPNVLTTMHEILATVQRRVGHWVGSSVVHLGDYNVPNALVFIDKYAQVQRILGPLCICIRRIGELSNDEYSNKRNVAGVGMGRGVGKYIEDTFGGVEAARKLILRDFFRYAFDGSGASDWFSAGSCIDGRLTSAWNWCSEIEKKNYWPLLLLTGFNGFDGDF